MILPRHYIIGLLMFSLFITSGIVLLGFFNDSQSGFTNDKDFVTFNQSFNQLDDISSKVSNLETSISGDPEDNDIGIFGVLGSLINSAWQTIKTIFDSFNIMGTLGKGMGSIFGIPAWVTTTLVSLVTVLFVFAIWSAVFQREL